MAIYKNGATLKAFKGDHRPVNVYVGNSKIAGWVPYMVSGTALSVSGTYEDDCSVEIAGKSEQAYVAPSSNLFNGAFINAYISPVTMNASTRLVIVPCLPNTKYVVSRNIAGVRFSVGYTTQYPSSGTVAYGIITQNTATNITITTGSDALWLVAYVYNSSFDTAIPVCWVTRSDTPQPYTAFIAESPSMSNPSIISSVANFNLIDTDGAERTQTENIPYTLRSLPSGVCDRFTIDNAASTKKITKVVDETTLTGARTWTFAQALTGLSRFYTFVSGAKVGTDNNAINVRCNRLQGVSWNSGAKNTTENVHTFSGDIRIGIVIRNSTLGILDADTSQQKVDKLVAYLNANSLIIQYEIAQAETPLSYAAKPTYYPSTHISTDAAVQPTLTGTFRVLGN